MIFQLTKNVFCKMQFPEIGAFDLGSATLQRWGLLQAYRAQLAYLQRISSAADMAAEAKQWCTGWIAAIQALGDSEARFKLANDASRWRKLSMSHPGSINGCMGEDTSRLERAYVHIMPYPSPRY